MELFRDHPHHRALAQDTRLHNRSARTGPPVLLMHGGTGTSYTGRRVAPQLVAAGYRSDYMFSFFAKQAGGAN